MKKITLHVVGARDVGVPPLELKGVSLSGWFSNATRGQLDLVVKSCQWPHDSRDCDAETLHRMLRSVIPAPIVKRPVDQIALLFCHSWRKPPGVKRLFGVMFDFDAVATEFGEFTDVNNVPREACAVFVSEFAGRSLEDVVFIALHELGHVFNLSHDSANDSFMATTTMSPRRFDLEDCRRLELACEDKEPWRWCHLPGGDVYQDRKPFQSSASLRKRKPTKSRNASRLHLTATLGKKRYLLGEMVALDLRLAVKGRGKVLIPADLDPGYETCRIWYETPAGERLLHASPLRFCRGRAGKVPVSASEPLDHNPRVTFGSKGLNFRDPGRYRLWAEFVVSARDGVIRSNDVELTVYAPRTAEEKEISLTLVDPVLAFFVCCKGCELSAAQKRRLRRLVRNHRTHEAVGPVLYALGAYHLKAGRRRLAAKYLEGLKIRQPSLAAGLNRMRQELSSSQ